MLPIRMKLFCCNRRNNPVYFANLEVYFFSAVSYHMYISRMLLKAQRKVACSDSGSLGMEEKVSKWCPMEDILKADDAERIYDNEKK